MRFYNEFSLPVAERSRSLRLTYPNHLLLQLGSVFGFSIDITEVSSPYINPGKDINNKEYQEAWRADRIIATGEARGKVN